MKAVVFDVKGSVAHFRRPDTTATQLTYPFITPTAAKGLVGSILGITDFVTRDKIGIQLLNPVRTSAQQLSMLGKDGGQTFNRPTTMELLVNPAYRLYYVGEEHTEELAEKLRNGQSVYHTYLGTAFALTFPQLVEVEDGVQEIADTKNMVIETPTVVPTHIIQELVLEEDRFYSRAGGFMKDYLGDRMFERSISYIYEKDGKTVKFKMNRDETLGCIVAIVGGQMVCLV